MGMLNYLNEVGSHVEPMNSDAVNKDSLNENVSGEKKSEDVVSLFATPAQKMSNDLSELKKLIDLGIELTSDQKHLLRDQISSLTQSFLSGDAKPDKGGLDLLEQLSAKGIDGAKDAIGMLQENGVLAKDEKEPKKEGPGKSELPTSVVAGLINRDRM